MKYSLIPSLFMAIISPAFATDGKDAKEIPAKPAKSSLVFKIVTDKESTEPETVYETKDGKIFVEPKARMDLGDVESARPALYPKGWVILLDFTPEGGRKFAKVTEENVGKRMAMIMNGKLLSAPIIREPIKGGSCEISGNFTREEATALATALESEIKTTQKQARKP